MIDVLPRVVLISLDAFNPGMVSRERTPRLWALGQEGGMARGGAAGPLPSATYVCHATMLTGASPARHGVTSNAAVAGRPGAVPGWAGERQVRLPTVLDACREAAIRAAALAGDWHIPQVAGALPGTDAVRWPEALEADHAAERDEFGYVTN
ncbi:MAG: alkaline phosphatase family protein, partial [Chloroflexota bacterium]